MAGKAAVQALRALLLVGMVASLPATSGWITVYVLAGVALLTACGCCCCNCCVGNLCDCQCDCSACGPCCPLCSEPCCEDCGCDCSPCGEACCGCGGCDAGSGGGGGGGGDDCCGGGDCGCSGCDCGCVESSPPEVAPAVAAAPLLVPLTRRLPAHWLSHHPDTPEYEQDTYPVAGLRFCVGCFTTYPLFLLASAWLALASPGGAWWAWLAGGATLACLQAVSSAGLARLRLQKAAVKTCLGLGLAAAVHGVLSAPWALVGKQAALLGLLVLAAASAVPRAVRMRGRA